MRVLLFIDSLGAGGAQRQLVGLAAMLKEKKYDVKVITYHNDSFFLPYLQNHNITFEWIQKASNKKIRIISIYKVIKTYKPVWVISYLDTPNIISSICKIFGLKFKLLVSERNTTQKVTNRERLKFILFKTADLIITNSDSQQAFIKNNFHSLASKTSVISNFVDTTYFNCDSQISRNKIPVIAVIATIWQSKNTLGFIEATNILKKKGYKFVIKWYGKSEAYIDYYLECINRINEYELNNYILLLEKTTDVKQVYLNADYFCLPSFYEGTPNVIIEALSCKLPVVCSSVCDNPKYVKDGVNGFLFDPYSIESMAQGLINVLNLSFDDYKSFGSESRRIAVTDCSKETFINKYINVLR